MPHKKKKLPPQHQNTKPGLEYIMNPLPIADDENYKGSSKLQGKVALITGGDSGIGRAVAIAFAKEGANVAIGYLNEKEDAKITKGMVEKYGRECLLFAGDIGEEAVCIDFVKKVISKFGDINIVVNNAAEQTIQSGLENITKEQLIRTFQTNIFSYFYITKAALPHLKQGDTIINTTSVTAYRGSEQLLDYSSTKGAIVAFTRSLSLSLIKKGIRVNGVAPGPIWTPLIPSSFPTQDVTTFGSDTQIGRVGQPCEVAPTYVYLATTDSSYVSGQILHVNGGEIING